MTSIKIYETRYLLDDVVDGDIQNARESGPILMTHDKDDEPAAEWAADHIIDAGCTEPSSSPDVTVGATWYSGTFQSNYYTGEQCDVSVHLEGFTPDQEREIYSRVTRR